MLHDVDVIDLEQTCAENVRYRVTRVIYHQTGDPSAHKQSSICRSRAVGGRGWMALFFKATCNACRMLLKIMALVVCLMIVVLAGIALWSYREAAPDGHLL